MPDAIEAVSTEVGQDAKSGEQPDRRGGGTGNAGGTDLHASAMVVAAVHLLCGTKIGWLDKVVADIPVAIRAETGGPGDDIGLELGDGSVVEIQVKKNLQRGAELWDALEALVDGVANATIDYGVLAIALDSSKTIREPLAADLIRIGQGAMDRLSDIGREWLDRLTASGRSTTHCARIRIQTLSLLESQDADRRSAVGFLRSMCLDADRADHAFNLIYRDAVALMRSRGRWTLDSVVRLLRSQDITLRDDGSPAGMVTSLSAWAETTRASFSLPAGTAMLPIQAMIPPRLVAIARNETPVADPDTALERYHGRMADALEGGSFNGEWIGRFIRLNVVVAGPGMGKSTLAGRIVWEYAREGIPVLGVALKRVAAAMASGTTFETALMQHGLGGSGVDLDRFLKTNIGQVVVVADGLDESGTLVDEVASGLVAYAAGHPNASIIVTTRPIGYETARLAEWRHYRLEPPVDKEGAGNLGRLIAAVEGLDPVHQQGTGQAGRALASTPARDAIVASPLMIGMAAALIVRDRRLPATKAGMYMAMIALFEDRDTDGAIRPTSMETNRILDVVGWKLMHDPLLTWPELRTTACSILARDMGRSPLAVSTVFETGFAHWERAGILERIHHGGAQLVTFVHKTFGEFAAARFLCELGEGRQRDLDRIVDEPMFGEVVSFAGAIGLGNELARLYVDRRDRGVEGQFERALALAADHEADVADDRTLELVEIAFSIVATGAGDRFSIGERLVRLAKAKPELVGPAVRDRLDDPNGEVRLIAWAAAVGSRHHDPERLDGVLDEFVKLILGDEAPRRSGIRANRLGKDVDLVQEIALAALDAKPLDEMADFVDRRLSDRPFTDFNFYTSVQALLCSKGVREPAFRWDRERFSSDRFARIIRSDNGWTKAANKAIHALASSVVHLSNTPAPDGPSQRPYLQFSALHKLADLGSAEARDVFIWTDEYDPAAIAETIRALVSVSRIDPVRLAREASEITARLETPSGDHLVSLELGHPDIPAPDWKQAALLPLDRQRIQAAFHHGSSWLLSVAANLLLCMPCDRKECAELLARSSETELFYAVQIVRAHLDDAAWRELLVSRVEAGPAEGTEYVLAALAESGIGLPASTGALVASALRSTDASLLAAAATLGRRWIESGGSVDPQLVESAYRGWSERERSATGARRVTRAREELLKLLIVSGGLDDQRMKDALSDADEGVRAAAAFLQVERATASAGDR
ncbi:NACHT domain-containing protein [Sphingomonas sp. NFX23]|uniref:NACHT domain-containing protein n=1 Tax=Sphingomonas sp. NFX23 TaxID=2819532 RepID=UPI003CF32E5C